MTGAFQDNAFQDDAFQMEGAPPAPPTPTRVDDIGLKELWLPPVVHTILRWFGAIVLIGAFQWWMT